jgi:hypothetical protein
MLDRQTTLELARLLNEVVVSGDRRVQAKRRDAARHGHKSSPTLLV